MHGHAQMILFDVNCQIVSLGSHEKMWWLLEGTGAEEWYVELASDIPSLSERIVGKFEEIHECKGNETTQRIICAQDKLRTIWRYSKGLFK